LKEKAPNRLKTLVGVIQSVADLTLEELAKSINYSREHFTSVIRKGPNEAIEKVLTDKYGKMVNKYFETQLTGLETAEDLRYVDPDQQLVEDSLMIKGMLRVLLRSQAELIAKQNGVSVSSVLKKMSKAIKDETNAEFDEL
jgi:predicted DNA-binding protein YlxM (UPF0122 family)